MPWWPSPGAVAGEVEGEAYGGGVEFRDEAAEALRLGEAVA